LERKQHNEVPVVPDILQETIQKYGVPEILIQIKKSITSEVHTNVLLNNGIKISMDGKDGLLLTTFFY
jgi:hypothetical protein